MHSSDLYLEFNFWMNKLVNSTVLKQIIYIVKCHAKISHKLVNPTKKKGKDHGYSTQEIDRFDKHQLSTEIDMQKYYQNHFLVIFFCPQLEIRSLSSRVRIGLQQ